MAITVLAYVLPAAAYRTGADLPEFAGSSMVRWKSPVIEFMLNTTIPAGLSLDAVQDVMVTSLSVWSQPSCTQVTFDYLGTSSVQAAPGDGNSTVQFVTSSWCPGSGNLGVKSGHFSTLAIVTKSTHMSRP